MMQLPVQNTASDCKHPYVIVTPPYTELSAGIRVLHLLCDALNRAGAEAYVCPDMSLGGKDADADAAIRAGLATPRLMPADRTLLERRGYAPIVVYPETPTNVLLDGLSVCYMLNYAGVMHEGVDLSKFDMLLAYSENIWRKTHACRNVLFLPVSDANYWIPPTTSRRHQALVYHGKYTEHHRQRIPLHLSDAVALHRQGSDAHSRAELRTLFQQSARLYVFENTALATEAALCGCPVVVCRNWFFQELIAEHELGTSGFSFEDTPESIVEASATIANFRLRYKVACSGFDSQLQSFIVASQEMANRLD